MYLLCTGSFSKYLQQLGLDHAEARVPELSLGVPVWVTSAQLLEPSTAVSQAVREQEAALEVELTLELMDSNIGFHELATMPHILVIKRHFKVNFYSEHFNYAFQNFDRESS